MAEPFCSTSFLVHVMFELSSLQRLAGTLDVVDLITPTKVECVGSQQRVISRPQDAKKSKDLRKEVEACLGEATPKQVKTKGPRIRRGQCLKPKTVGKKKKKAETGAEEKEPEPKADKKEKKTTKKMEAKPIKKDEDEDKEEKCDMDDSTALGEGESKDDSAKPAKSTEGKRRRRRFRKKTLTKHDLKLTLVKSMLAKKGISWQYSQWYHSRFPTTNDAQVCKESSGFKEMQARMAEGKPPECLTCMAMLEEFDHELLNEELDKIDLGTAASPFTKMKKEVEIVTVEGPAVLPCLQPASPKPQPAEQTEDPDPAQLAIVPYDEANMGSDLGASNAGPAEAGHNDDQEDEESMWALFKSMKCLELLGPGILGKRLAAKCHACRSANQREGKIFDLCKRRRQEINFFTKQHLGVIVY